MMERPWLKNYPAGVPANIDNNKYNTVIEFAEDCFTKYAKLTAFECMGKKMTYGELGKKVEAFAGYLHSRGLKPGDRIAIMMPNLLQYPIAMFGSLKAGLIVVNTNPLYTAREMKHQITDSGVTAIIICENFAHNLEKIIDETDINVVITASIGGLLGGFKGAMTNFVVRTVKRMVPKFSIPNTVEFKTTLKEGAKFTIKPFENKFEDVIVHQYTGGTTGVAKGAMLTNANLLSNLTQLSYWMQVSLEEKKEIALSPLPMYHIFAFAVNCLAMMSIGAHTVLVTNARDLKSVIKEFKTHKITFMSGVNTLFNALLNQPDFTALDFSSFKFAIGGGMAVQDAVSEKWKEVTGNQIVQGYGLTETSPVATANPFNELCKLGTIGMPLSSTDLRIVDDQGNPLAQGEVGEIQIKGPQVMKGYYNRPEATADCIKDGWFSSGDIGLMQEDGYFRIVDRKKDMILVSGFNVYPNEIEEVIVAHDKVLEVAAIGIPDAKSGEVVKIFVVKKDKSVTKDEIIAYCRENLTGYKVPKEVEFRDDLPKTNVGKILRRKLRDA
jgi:long-chain acyl-CoA synthetase